MRGKKSCIQFPVGSNSCKNLSFNYCICSFVQNQLLLYQA